MKNKFNLVFFASAALIEILYIQFIILNNAGNIPLYIFTYMEVFLLFLLGFYLVKQEVIIFKLPPVISNFLSRITGIAEDLSVPGFIILTAILFRLTLFPSALTTSPDAYRYIWEGKVIASGYNPFALEPLSPQLKHLHTEDLPSKINFPEKKAIYPPVAQGFFVLSYIVSGNNFTGLKLIYLIAEIFTFIFLLKLLHLKKKNLNYIILYAWLPLPVMEYFINAHLDVFGITLFVIFIYLFEKEKYYISGIFFSLSVLSKLVPVFLVPLLIKKAGLKKSAVIVLTFFLMAVILYYPFVSKGTSLFSFLLLYIERWEFNASVYYLLKLFTTGAAARIICAGMFIAVVLIISYYYKDFTKAAAGVLIAFTIFAATVYPWYLGWLAVINPVWPFSSAVSLFFTVNMSNFTPMSPIWKEYTIVLLAEYIPFFILLGYDLRKNLKRSPKIADQG